jgi:tRNA threonylcarbamoyladenosine biosynthesis protein TsaE
MSATSLSTSEVTHSEEQTIDAGASFARRLRPGDIVACYGELGSGKTRFIKGACRGLGVSGHVTSPTFTIVNEYAGGAVTVFHFDFYRMASTLELREIGFDDYLNRGGICLIEWAERVAEFLPRPRYDVHLVAGEAENDRSIRIECIPEETA